MTSPSSRVRQGVSRAPCSARIAAMGRSLAWVQAWKAATSWAWLISPVWSASRPKRRSREGSTGRGMIVSSPAGGPWRTLLARSHTGFREEKWRRGAGIVTMCRPDGWEALCRRRIPGREPMEQRWPVRRGDEVPRGVLGTDEVATGSELFIASDSLRQYLAGKERGVESRNRSDPFSYS